MDLSTKYAKLERSALPKLHLNPEVLKYVKETFRNPNGPHSPIEDDGCGRVEHLLEVLGTPPLFTTLRLNSRRGSLSSVKLLLGEVLAKQYVKNGQVVPIIQAHPTLHDVLIIANEGPLKLTKDCKEVVVGLACGMSVLRGADVFAQGIMGAPVSMQCGDLVSVYADIDGACRKGWTQKFDGAKLFVGNGRVRISRHDLFCSTDTVSGVGIQMTEPLYLAPSLSGVLPELIFPQNLPSVVCSHVLDPQPGERVLDMCASPGGKTTHIATLMNDKGCVIALDKSESKLSKVKKAAEAWGLTCIQAFPMDARRCLASGEEGPNGGPPFLAESFDRVLVDAPCSALGQRPSTKNNMTAAEVKSYPALQQQILNVGVKLLKPGGVLVYSTCTITVQENEHQVAAALERFPELSLQPQIPHIGGCGLEGSSLTLDQTRLVQRFDPAVLTEDTIHTAENDTIGFFCAKFVKQPR